MGFLVYAILFFLAYLIFSQFREKRRIAKDIDSFLSDNIQIINRIIRKEENVLIPDFKDYHIFIYNIIEDNIILLSKDINNALIDEMKHLNISQRIISKGITTNKGKKIFLERSGYLFVYTYSKEMENYYFIFVAKRTSIDGEITDIFNRR